MKSFNSFFCSTPIRQIDIDITEEEPKEELDLSLLTVEELEILLKAFSRKERPKQDLMSEWE